MNGLPATWAEWFDRHTLGAPPALLQRARAFIDWSFLDSGVTTDRPKASHWVDRLADAGARALETSAAHNGHRAGALDLLVADALITLALLAAAEFDAADLAETAARLRQRLVPVTAS